MNDDTNNLLTNDFDPHTMRVLEYGAIVAMLAERTACALGAERARELLPSPVHAFVQERQQETREARKLIGDFGAIPLGGIYDVRPYLVRAEVGQSLSPGELLHVASTILNGSRLKTFLVRHVEKAPLLADRAKAIHDFPPLLGEIENAIGRDGTVQDSASTTLAALRTQVRNLAKRVDERLNQYLSGNFRAMLQDPLIVLRDDRRCLPVKAEYKSAIKGIVHDQSASGATLFIEPMPVVELNNELRQQEMKERAEIQRILAKLTSLVAKQAEKIHGTCEVIAGIDLAHAKARLAGDMNATEPTFNNKGFVRIREGRHPLLDPDNVVPTTLTLGDKYKTLLITGPNTGGKTVTLKTVGLFTLMAQAGMQVPASQGTELAYFDQVFADIGDEQSIAQSLSTFSAHITNIVRILKQVGTRALVLMDE
jgi:DNA mismatch repair protein MutS2